MSHQGFFCFFYRIFVFSIRYYIQRGKRRSSVMRAAKFPAAGTDRKIPVKVRKKATAPVDGNRGSRRARALRSMACVAGRGVRCGCGVRCGARCALRVAVCIAEHGVRCRCGRALRVRRALRGAVCALPKKRLYKNPAAPEKRRGTKTYLVFSRFRARQGNKRGDNRRPTRGSSQS